MRIRSINALKFALCFSVLLIFHSHAMTFDELSITGTISATDVNDYLSFFPSSVALLYTQRGGRVVVIPCKRIDAIARRYGVYEERVEGLYVFRTKRIYLADTDMIAINLAHELGHFLFEETRPSWSKTDREKWTDTEEFAQHYSRRDADFRSIEQSIEKLIIR